MTISYRSNIIESSLYVLEIMLQIKKATKEQLKDIVDLYKNCGRAMLEQGFDNWAEDYPSIQSVLEDLVQQHLYCLMEGKKLLGVMVLDEKQPLPYQEVLWQYEATKVLVVHRLAVAVQEQKKGYARQLMHYAEQYAKQERYAVIRLDAYSINERLLNFYERLGYQSAQEAIYLDAQIKHPFICFEKSITK